MNLQASVVSELASDLMVPTEIPQKEIEPHNDAIMYV